MATGSTTLEEFAFGFDEPLEPLVFSRAVAVSGWLVHTGGDSIRGIRVIATKALRPRRTARARRKRQRMDIAAAFPRIPAAESSGFYVELPLRAGWNRLVFQAQDAQARWRTFFETQMRLLPLDLLRRARLRKVHAHLATSLRHSNGNSNHAAMRVLPPRPAPPARHEHGLLAAPARIAILATKKSNLFIRELGELVAAGFRDLGYASEIRYDEPPRIGDEETLQIVLTPHEFYNLYLLENESLESARKLSREVVLLSTEQPKTTWAHQNGRWVSYARATADINPVGVAAYRAAGVPALHLGLGFHPLLAHPQQQPHDQRSVDVTFLGSLTPRRDAFFARHAAYFAGHYCHIRFVPLGFAKTEQTRSYLAPTARNALLSDSKILLNLHYSDQRYFEWHRMLLGLANGCCVITEPCEGYAPLVPNTHFVMVESDSLIDAVEYYLAHPDEATAIAAAGRTFLETQLRQENLCAQFLKDYQQFAADGAFQQPLAPDSPPAPLPLQLSEKLAPPTASVFYALVDDLRDVFRPNSQPQITIESHWSEEQDPTLREQIIRQRAGYRERYRQQQEQRARGESVWTVYDNAGCSAMPSAKISVVVTLFNYARFIQECLCSVVESKIDAPLELVIIDDASTDTSLARARALQSRFTHPVRIVHKHFNTGLADARNIGIEFARAPYVFMLDADNLVTPKALAQLLATMEAGNFAAAFTLLCRFRESPRAGLGLLSYYDWDPEILVQSPYIDAMAMFRRDVLLALGGYDGSLSEIGWFGWEDYDMWLRFAQLNLPVGFVPNVLCLYRQHESSMIRTTNLFWPELIKLFSDRYTALINRYPLRERLFGVPRRSPA